MLSSAAELGGSDRKNIQNASAYAKVTRIKIITNENIRLATQRIITRYLSKNSIDLKKLIAFACNNKREVANTHAGGKVLYKKK